MKFFKGMTKKDKVEFVIVMALFGWFYAICILMWWYEDK